MQVLRKIVSFFQADKQSADQIPGALEVLDAQACEQVSGGLPRVGEWTPTALPRVGSWIVDPTSETTA